MKIKPSQHIFKKYTYISNFMKLDQMGAELFHADRQMDMTKLLVAFRNFVSTPKSDHVEVTAVQ